MTLDQRSERSTGVRCVSGVGPQSARIDRARWVSDLHQRADVAPFDDPLWFAVGLGYRTRPLMVGERFPARPDSNTIYYVWSKAGRELGAHVYIALAEKLLALAEPSRADVMALCSELALPESALRGRGAGEIVNAQLHAPVSWITERIIGLRPSGFRPVGT